MSKAPEKTLTPRIGGLVRRQVYGMEAIRSGIGVSIVLDLGETVLTMDERKFYASMHGTAYGGDPGDRDVFINLTSGWTAFRIPEVAWMQFAQTRERIRQEDLAALAEAFHTDEVVTAPLELPASAEGV